MISANLVGCSTARNKGPCANRVNIRRNYLEERVLNALRHHLMEPALFAEFCEEFTREMNRLRMAGPPSIDAAEVKRIDRELDTLLNLILKSGAADRPNEKMVALEARQKELRASLAEAQEPPPPLHPNTWPTTTVSKSRSSTTPCRRSRTRSGWRRPTSCGLW